MNQTEKNVNIELLRTVSMLMILTLHYFAQGQVLELTERSAGVTWYLVWAIEAFCLVSVNLYMLISGYFLSTKTYSWRRLLSFYATILFYTVVLTIICYSTGLAKVNFDSLTSTFPIVAGRGNWYVTVYVVVLTVSPLLNVVAQTLEKAVYRRLMYILFVLFSLIPSVICWVDQFDLQKGYSVLWFVYLYLLAAYIRRFGVKIKIGFALPMILSLVILPLVKYVIVIFFSSTAIEKAQYALYGYNAFPVFLASVAIFCLVVNSDRRIKSKVLSAIIFYLGKTSFGVFFIHSFVLLREKLWIGLGSKFYIGSPLQFVHCACCVLSVYLICSLIDTVKSTIFRYLWIDRLIKRISGKLDEKFSL